MGEVLAVAVGVAVLGVIAAVYIIRSRRAQRSQSKRKLLSGTRSAWARGRVDDRRALWARRYGAGSAWAAGGMVIGSGLDEHGAGSTGSGGGCGGGGAGCGGGGCGGGCGGG
jgi:hypothetical protein